MAADYATAISPQARAGARTNPGELDNLLSLDPNDPRWKDTLDTWEDGGEYAVSLTIRQVSPGKFEVSELMSESPETTEEEAQTEIPTGNADMESMGVAGGPQPNSAVRRMMEA